MEDPDNPDNPDNPNPPAPSLPRPASSPFESLIQQIVVFRDDDEEEEDANGEPPPPSSTVPVPPEQTKQQPSDSAPSAEQLYIDPTPHVSSQFYTFNRESHALMVRCILDRRLATPDEIRHATPRPVLRSWRSVWKDRNEGTAYTTAWKRIQDKLNAHVDARNGQELLYFKNNASQYVSHVEQWQEIVTSFHGDADLRHLGLKDTIDRIKQVWTVGAKFYGIPESFVRVCLASCAVCTGGRQVNGGGGGGGGGGASRSKRRRFEYTESFDVPAREVPQRLQQLAAKHKVVLCIRQKYIRYKPFMAEVKDYACHRAGEPSSSSSSTSAKKARALKREPYASKRCGCGFRIRAIVPIANYSDKDKTFVYQEEGTAVFKLYAVHTGHEPGPLDGNARIIHRVVGHKGVLDQDSLEYGVNDELEPDSYVSLMGKEVGGGDHLQLSVAQHVQELRSEVGFLEGKIQKVPRELLGLLSRELPDILHRIRNLRENLLLSKTTQCSEDAMVVGDAEIARWDDTNQDTHDVIYDKEVELIEEEDSDFGHALTVEMPWELMRSDFRSRKVLARESCKAEKWMIKDCCRFGEKSILDYCEEEEDSKLIKPLRRDGSMETDSALVGLQVDGFYPDTTKWYDSPNGLDPDVDSGDGGFRHGDIG